MKLTVVLLQVALVVVGILVYDQIRGPAADPADADQDASTDPGEGRSREPGESALRGNVLEQLDRRLESVEKRQKALERAFASRTPPPVDEGTAPTPRSGSEMDIRGEDIAWFRAVRRQADQLERQDSERTAMGVRIDRLRLDISAAQRDQVVDALVEHQRKTREAIRAPVRPEDRESRAGMMRNLRAELEQVILRLVPAEEAEKILRGVVRLTSLREQPDRSPPR